MPPVTENVARAQNSTAYELLRGYGVCTPLPVGDFAQLAFHVGAPDCDYECLWVCVTKASADHLEGVVCNEPRRVTLEYGARVVFHADNVVDTMQREASHAKVM